MNRPARWAFGERRNHKSKPAALPGRPYDGAPFARDDWHVTWIAEGRANLRRSAMAGCLAPTWRCLSLGDAPPRP